LTNSHNKNEDSFSILYICADLGRVFAAGDVTTGETLVVKAMASGREAAQRVHEYLMNINEENHMSFYERYYIENSYDRMLEDTDDKGPPPE